MDIRSYQGSQKYLKAGDLQGRPVIVTIRDVVVETVGQGRDSEEKPVVCFVGKEKGLVLNTTNGNSIADEFGDQFCITIQELRISILNEGCLTNGKGFAVGFNETPRAAIAGLRLVITTTYQPTLFDDDTEVTLTFTGDRQLDGSYVGRLRTRETTIEVVGGEEFVFVTISERNAVLTRN